MKNLAIIISVIAAGVFGWILYKKRKVNKEAATSDKKLGGLVGLFSSTMGSILGTYGTVKTMLGSENQTNGDDTFTVDFSDWTDDMETFDDDDSENNEW